jgi:hypothetical protein
LLLLGMIACSEKLPMQTPSAVLVPNEPAGKLPGKPLISLGENATDNSTSVELLGVKASSEIGFIEVSFKADTATSGKWFQANNTMYVIDETNGREYREIPVMPKIGPLVGRPLTRDQVGFVMFMNRDFSIKPGSIVTVVLGEWMKEHVKVE